VKGKIDTSINSNKIVFNP